MVGHDLKLDEGIGTCGKDGQSVPVGVGMPTIKLDKMTVGGTGQCHIYESLHKTVLDTRKSVLNELLSSIRK
jgi:hypothetical protein